MHAARHQLRLYRLLVEHSLGLMCIHDLTGCILAVNPAVAASLGYDTEEGVGRNLRDFLSPAVVPLFDSYLQRLRAKGKDDGQMRLVAKDGSERIWLYRNVLFEDESGARVLGHALDITERAATERELRHTRLELVRARDELAARVAERTRQLEQTNGLLRAEMVRSKHMQEDLIRTSKLESLALLAGGIAHDFNNFLTVVQGNVELAKTYTSPDEPISDLLDQTGKACERAAQLASQLLTFGKGGAPVRQVVRLDGLIRSAIEVALAGSGVRVEYDAEAGLWPAEVDPGQINQVLHNILLNARQAMPDGGVIEVRADNVVLSEAGSRGDPVRCVQIYIQDTGVGIATENLPRIFDPYFTTKQTGTGLGLATAHSIVTRHRGQISVHSTPGKGTTFVIQLPASSYSEAVAAPPARQASAGHGSILVMDDDPSIRLLLTRTLIRAGYQVTAAADGREAIQLYKIALSQNQRFSLVLLDLTVPGGMGGQEASVELLLADPEVRMVVTSGYSDAPILANFRDHGFLAVLAKPWTAARILEVVSSVIGRSSGAVG
jgi:PAS domain S-box-containing protein